MKTCRHAYLLAASAIFITMTFTGCEKDDSSGDKDSFEGMLYYYSDVAKKEIRVIDINASSPFRRLYILDEEVTLEAIALGREHHVLKAYRPSSTSTMASAKGMMIKSKVADSQWLFVADYPFPGLTGIADEGWYEASEYGEGATGFILHNKGKEEGEPVYAIESLKYPGTYFSHDGHPIQGANLLYLKPFDSPDKAPGFRLFMTDGIRFTEGDPNVPRDFDIGNP
ncbi:hypothetical protein EG830_02290 [bacterium]|nr:hypothetical protein [bacterium]